MALGLNNDKNTRTTKANSFRQHLKRWMAWRPRKSQQNIPPVEYNNYLMISPCTDESIHNCPPSYFPPIPKDGQSTIVGTTQSSIDHLQQLQQQNLYDENLSRLSNCTDGPSHLDSTLHTDSYSSNNTASANRRHPTLIDINNVQTKPVTLSTYSRLTGPLTTSAFSDITNSRGTSSISTTSVQQVLPLSPSWDSELQQDRDASLIDSDMSTLPNSLSDIGSTMYAQPNVHCNDGSKQLVYEWLSDSDNEDDANNDPSSFTLGNNAISAPHDHTFTQYSSLIKRGSLCARSTTQHDTDSTASSPSPLTSTFFTSSTSPTQYAECDNYDLAPLEDAAKLDDPGSTTSFFTTTSSFDQQDLEDDIDATRSSIYSTPFTSSSLDKDTMLLVTHAVNFLKNREDSNWDDDDDDNNNNDWPYPQMRLDVSPTAAKTSSTKALNDDITPSPSTSTASTLVPPGGRKLASLLQDKNTNGIPDRKETTDEEFHRIVSTLILF